MKKRTIRPVVVLLVFAVLTGISYSLLRTNREEPKVLDIKTPVQEPPVDKRPYEEIIRELEERLQEAKALEEIESKEVDLIIFMGQSNMSGNGGDPKQAPAVQEGAGYEFRAVSDPTKLYTITEPFGFYENKPLGISDGTAKRGSLVSAFVNKYYQETGIPVVAISCSQGATHTGFWVNPGAAGDAVMRFSSSSEWLTDNGYQIRRRYMVWFQGESDAIYGVSPEIYATNMDIIVNSMISYGVEKCFVIRVGQPKSNPVFTDKIQKVQTQICKNDPRFIMASTMVAGFDISYMVDEWHYNQAALNMIGEDAAKNMALYRKTGVEPSMHDYKYGDEYVPITYQKEDADEPEE